MRVSVILSQSKSAIDYIFISDFIYDKEAAAEMNLVVVASSSER